MKQFVIITIINLIIALTSSAVMPEPSASQPIASPIAASATKAKKKVRKKKAKKKASSTRKKKKTSTRKRSATVNKYWELGYDDGYEDGYNDGADGAPIIIEANYTYGQFDFHQLCNGPILQELTETERDNVLHLVFKNKE